MASPNKSERTWLTLHDLAARCGVSWETVRTWRASGVGPPAYKLGRHVRFDLDDVVTWEESQRDPRPIP